MSLPAVAVILPPEARQAGSFGLPAHWATNADTSVRSLPWTRFAGITVVPVGVTWEPSAHLVTPCDVVDWLSGAGHEMPCSGTRIWSATTCWIVLCSNPWSRTAEKALSRFGPTMPLAPAAAIV